MSINTDFDAVMDAVCLGCGFCGSLQDDKPVHVTDYIPQSGPVSAEQFVEWLFLADNMREAYSAPKWRDIRLRLQAMFVEHMGAEVVDASRLRWEFPADGDSRDA